MRNILITGASSGIGAALARKYAAPGVRLGLLARDSARLEAVAAAARAAGAECVVALADVRDRAAIERAVGEFEAGGPIDLLIVNAGIFTGRRAGENVESLETSLASLDVNLTGALTTLHAALPAMRARRRGRVALVASLAGLSPLGGALGYSAAKSALVSYGLGLRQVLWDEGVTVSVVCPGFVETAMSATYVGRRLFTLTADEAAEKIARGVERGKALVAFPALLHLMTRTAIIAPDVVRRIAGRVFACRDASAPASLGTGAAVVLPDAAANDPARQDQRKAV
ncbi:MAG: SDR family NAD(P)-dependent oxidoreductase [Methylobacteriaceae bacterium]|nr:SDR family NAD(P)-dependent oxidoreductase [Methylobacteriaceae bacterium]